MCKLSSSRKALRCKLEALDESKRRIDKEWQAVWDTWHEVGETDFNDIEARQLASVKASRDLYRLEDEEGPGINRDLAVPKDPEP
jgi:hypothetical protein